MIRFIAGLCFIAGVVAGLPLYETFWWWDLFAHGITGFAIIAALYASEVSHIKSFSIVTAIAFTWEFIEPHIHTAPLPIHFATGDWITDILATLVGAVIGVALELIRSKYRNGQ